MKKITKKHVLGAWREDKIKDAPEEEKGEDEMDDHKPFLNFSNKMMDPPRTRYNDQGDSSQKEILKR